MSASVFISFASQDTKVANTICAAIESRGFKCWISSRDILPGENFQSAIVRAIRSSKILLLVFTSNSNRSDEMTKELALASQQKLMVVPLRVEDVTPSDAFAYEFATRQWIDLFADWELAMNQLCTRMGAALANEPHSTETIVLGKPATDTAATPPAPAPVAFVSSPARAAKKNPAPATKGAGKPPLSPVLKAAAAAVLLVAAAAVAVPSLMGKKSATVASAAKPEVIVPAVTPQPAPEPAVAEPAVVVATAPEPAAPEVPAAPATATTTTATTLNPVAADSTGAVTKDLPKESAKPVERKKRVAAKRSSSNVPY